MKPNNTSDIQLFNEKAEVLKRSSFYDVTIRNQSGLIMEWQQGKDPESVFVGAEGESVEAIFLTLRMFLQKNDRISIASIAEIYLDEKELSPYKTDFEEIRGIINTFLSAKNGVDFCGDNYTNGEAIDLLLYGSMGHTNRKKHEQLKFIMQSGMAYQLFLFQVNGAVGFLIKEILALAEVNKRALNANI